MKKNLTNEQKRMAEKKRKEEMRKKKNRILNAWYATMFVLFATAVTLVFVSDNCYAAYRKLQVGPDCNLSQRTKCEIVRLRGNSESAKTASNVFFVLFGISIFAPIVLGVNKMD